MRVIAFHNLKGGVGKTAAAVNTAYLASQAGISTLLWDLDPQGAASWFLGDDGSEDAQKLGKLVKGKSPIGEFVRDTPYPDLDLIPAHHSFRNIDIKLDDADNDRLLKRWLKPLSEETSLVVLDCPPSLSRLAEQVLRTADAIYVPLIPTWLSLNSWEQLNTFADDRKIRTQRLHPFFSMADQRKALHRDLVTNRTLHLPGGMDTVIPNDSAVERMGERRLPVERVAHRSRGAEAFRSLWREIHQMLWRSPA